jgi:predicted RNA methylase
MSMRWILASLFLLAPVLSRAQVGETENMAPFVPSPQVVVDKMLEASQLKAGETLYDLGSGDGRIVITAARKFGARAVGVELSHDLCSRARREVEALGLTGQVSIIHSDLMKVDLSPADVVTLYLLTSSNARIRPKLEKYLKPGARVVSHDFVIRGWTPVRTERVQADSRVHTIYVYEIAKPKR